MLIIAAKNAFLKQRTGVEKYAFQLLKHLASFFIEEEIIVFTNKIEEKIDFPENFHLKIIRMPFLWTQIGLSWEMLKIRIKNYELRIKRKLVASNQRPVTMKLFIPAHVMPLIHPRHTVVTVHGLEYEYLPEYYGWFSRKYLRWSTRYATKHAGRIIAVSENTKRDLVKLYGADSKKIIVVYHGVNKAHNMEHGTEEPGFARTLTEYGNRRQKGRKYFLYLGRIELKKNVQGIIKAFEAFKSMEQGTHNREHITGNREQGTGNREHGGEGDNFQFPTFPSMKFISNKDTKKRGDDNIDISGYKLVLAGGKGYGWEIVKHETYNMKHKKDIILTGYVDEKKKWELLENAQALVFPSFYEGFGMPIPEAQSVGLPVITTKGSSMEEITTMNQEDTRSALLVDPHKPEEIAKAMHKIISDKKLRDGLIRRGYENVKRFSWEKCARKTLKTLMATNIDTNNH